MATGKASDAGGGVSGQAGGRRRAGRWGLWVWFGAGFAVVFVGMLVGVRMRALDPSGRYLVECRLWEYYRMELPGEFRVSEPLGPGSGQSLGVMRTAGEHVLASGVGGGLAMGMGWVVRRVRGRK